MKKKKGSGKALPAIHLPLCLLAQTLPSIHLPLCLLAQTLPSIHLPLRLLAQTLSARTDSVYTVTLPATLPTGTDATLPTGTDPRPKSPFPSPPLTCTCTGWGHL